LFVILNNEVWLSSTNGKDCYIAMVTAVRRTR
jgi:hypothetical protein